MATEADLIQKFKDLNIPVGADFEELIHEAFIGANLVEQVNSKADDSKVVHKTGAEGISGQKMFDVAPIDKTTGNPYITRDGVPTIDLSNYPTKDQLATKSDDSTVVHNSGNEEISGSKTFDTAPIDKKTGNPYITKDGVPSVPSTLADMTKDANFTGKLQKSGIDVATKSDVTTAVSTATANMVDSTKATNFTAGLKSGGVDVATAADLKSIKDSAWRQLDNKYITPASGTISSETTVLFRIDQTAKRLYLQGVILVPTVSAVTSVSIDFSSVVKTISPDTPYPISYAGDNPFSTYSATVISNKLRVATDSSGISLIATRSNNNGAPYVTYDELV